MSVVEPRCHCMHRVKRLGEDVMQRDTRSWDPVSGRCGRCGLHYRPRAVLPVEGARPVALEDLRPTDVGDGVDRG